MLGNRAGRSGGRSAPREVRVHPVWPGEGVMAPVGGGAPGSPLPHDGGWSRGWDGGGWVKAPQGRARELGPFPEAGQEKRGVAGEGRVELLRPWFSFRGIQKSRFVSHADTTPGGRLSLRSEFFNWERGS